MVLLIFLAFLSLWGGLAAAERRQWSGMAGRGWGSACLLSAVRAMGKDALCLSAAEFAPFPLSPLLRRPQPAGQAPLRDVPLLHACGGRQRKLAAATPRARHGGRRSRDWLACCQGGSDSRASEAGTGFSSGGVRRPRSGWNDRSGFLQSRPAFLSRTLPPRLPARNASSFSWSRSAKRDTCASGTRPSSRCAQFRKWLTHPSLSFASRLLGSSPAPSDTWRRPFGWRRDAVAFSRGDSLPPASRSASSVSSSRFNPVRGSQDLPPLLWRLHHWLFSRWRETATSFGFQEFSTPVVEHAELYVHPAGEPRSRRLEGACDAEGDARKGWDVGFARNSAGPRSAAESLEPGGEANGEEMHSSARGGASQGHGAPVAGGSLGGSGAASDSAAERQTRSAQGASRECCVGNVPPHLYLFRDQSARVLALRPELTPSLCRLLLRLYHAKPGREASSLPRDEEGASQEGEKAGGEPQRGGCALATLERLVASPTLPVRWTSIADCWRYERMARGRRRQHWQWNLDIVTGPSDAADNFWKAGQEEPRATDRQVGTDGEGRREGGADLEKPRLPDVRPEAEVLAAAVSLLEKLGLGPEDVEIRVGSRRVLEALLVRLGVVDGPALWLEGGEGAAGQSHANLKARETGVEGARAAAVSGGEEGWQEGPAIGVAGAPSDEGHAQKCAVGSPAEARRNADPQGGDLRQATRRIGDQERRACDALDVVDGTSLESREVKRGSRQERGTQNSRRVTEREEERNKVEQICQLLDRLERTPVDAVLPQLVHVTGLDRAKALSLIDAIQSFDPLTPSSPPESTPRGVPSASCVPRSPSPPAATSLAGGGCAAAQLPASSLSVSDAYLRAAAEEVRALFKLFPLYGFSPRWLKWHPLTVRGLSYYTGLVFEAFERVASSPPASQEEGSATRFSEAGAEARGGNAGADSVGGARPALPDSAAPSAVASLFRPRALFGGGRYVKRGRQPGESSTPFADSPRDRGSREAKEAGKPLADRATFPVGLSLRKRFSKSGISAVGLGMGDAVLLDLLDRRGLLPDLRPSAEPLVDLLVGVLDPCTQAVQAADGAGVSASVAGQGTPARTQGCQSLGDGCGHADAAHAAAIGLAQKLRREDWSVELFLGSADGEATWQTLLKRAAELGARVVVGVAAPARLESEEAIETDARSHIATQTQPRVLYSVRLVSPLASRCDRGTREHRASQKREKGNREDKADCLLRSKRSTEREDKTPILLTAHDARAVADALKGLEADLRGKVRAPKDGAS
ncbi:hypothetical protein BESB_026400 [Besnoitia besnoiti]|uniref:histidine--tRNA ligase n=1 Tax=Besnoitia besnoiti TaxID=94643 RepID=A0A2A9M6Z9_BESBE|nr:uncharacterized protein BESB_026400 [Besnoitia besnoiti]PFH31666.1 hypothetical protein BESB_026400 [Besnoitia besnoiti]